MIIKHLKREEFESILPLVWEIFLKYEAIEYPEKGKSAFYQAIHSKVYQDMLDVYSAYDGNKLIGVIATRENKTHIALFFVDGQYHRRGVGKKLFQECMKNNNSKTITVHSSIYAAEVYRKLGFVATDKVQEEDGIRYIPMALTR